jgi:hypothetical protein
MILTDAERNEYQSVDLSLKLLRESLIKLVVQEKDWKRGAELTKSLRAVEVMHNRMDKLVDESN